MTPLPEGKTFQCRHCGHTFPPKCTLGVVGAHMEEEHPGRDAEVILVDVEDSP